MREGPLQRAGGALEGLGERHGRAFEAQQATGAQLVAAVLPDRSALLM